MTRNRTYLGDGVYASFDGYQIWLETDREFGTHCIALEPPVFASLIKYEKEVRSRVEDEPQHEHLKEKEIDDGIG